MDPNYYAQPITNNSDSSSSSEECSVCLEKVHKDDMYAKIDSDNEANKKYHPYCLDNWFSRSTLGIISREDVDSYSIYSAKVPIEQVSVSDLSDNHPDEHAVLINDQDTILDNINDGDSNQSAEDQNYCRKIVIRFIVPFIICMLVSAIVYFMFQ